MSNVTQLEVWLQGFPREEAEKRIRRLEAELTTLRNALALHDAFASQNGTSAKDESDEPANRPDAIRRVIRSGGNQPIAPKAIKNELIDRGWLEDTEPASKRFYSAMYTMTKRGHILRLQDGRYVLPDGTGGDG